MYTTNKDLNKFVKELIKIGWTPERKGKGHWQIRSPGGTVHTIASSPGDFRTIIKFKSDIRRTQRSENESKRLNSRIAKARP